MTTEEAISRIQDVLSSDYHYDETIGYQLTSDDLDWLNTALGALLAHQEAEKNEPLTLDELQEMDGEAVYIRMGDGREGWAILVWDCGCPLLYGPDYDDAVTGEPDVDFYDLAYSGPESIFGLHYLGWLAYRHRPKEEI